MDLKVGSAVKALLILVGMFLGVEIDVSQVETAITAISGAVMILAAIGWDIYETVRLKKQGVKSTSPKVNAAEPMTPAKLVKEEAK